MSTTEVLRKAREAIELQIRYHSAPFNYDRDAAMAKSHAAIVAIDAALATPAAADGEPDIGSSAVNEACWAFIGAWPGQMDGRGWNNLKPAIYAAIMKYRAAAPSAVASPSECDSLTDRGTPGGQEGDCRG